MVIEKRDLTMYLGLGVSLLGVVLYDPLGFLFTGAGLIVIALGLICVFVSYKQLSEIEIVNKAVEDFEKIRRR
jgi:cytochrome c biogenesis protein CcdA|tara:strand:- start:467 stop:685 length:219 start_codon:yes stop_codon:yes gene_type:complete